MIVIIHSNDNYKSIVDFFTKNFDYLQTNCIFALETTVLGF
jgi:hypothetical protein